MSFELAALLVTQVLRLSARMHHQVALLADEELILGAY